MLSAVLADYRDILAFTLMGFYFRFREKGITSFLITFAGVHLVLAVMSVKITIRYMLKTACMGIFTREKEL